jgi:hypothetical protein
MSVTISCGNGSVKQIVLATKADLLVVGNIVER